MKGLPSTPTTQVNLHTRVKLSARNGEIVTHDEHAQAAVDMLEKPVRFHVIFSADQLPNPRLDLYGCGEIDFDQTMTADLCPPHSDHPTVVGTLCEGPYL